MMLMNGWVAISSGPHDSVLILCASKLYTHCTEEELGDKSKPKFHINRCTLNVF
jgi:hypothetical protein